MSDDIPSAAAPFTDVRSGQGFITTAWFRFLQQVSGAISNVFDTITVTNNVISIDGIATVGRFGVPVIVGYGRSVGAIAAIVSLATYTVDSADGTFEVSSNVRVTTATNHNFTVTCSYTDEAGTARVATMTFLGTPGTVLVNAVANANGTVPYQGIPIHIRAKSGTAITTATTGVFTTVVYNAESVIRQLA